MRILYVSDQCQWGGTEVSLTTLADYIKMNGHAIHFSFSETYNQKNCSKVTYVCGKNRYLRLLCLAIKGYDPIALRSSIRAIKKIMPDIVDVTQVSRLSLAPLLAARELGIPHLLTVRYPWLVCPCGGRLLKPNGEICTESTWENCHACTRNDESALIRIISHSFQHQVSAFTKRIMLSVYGILKDEVIVANSNSVKNILTRFGFDSDRVHVIPPPIDVDAFTPSYSHENIILWVGTFIDAKGPEYFVKMADYLKNKMGYSKMDFVMIGGGPLLKRYANNKNIKIIGEVPLKEVIEYYRRALAVVVTPIWFEPFGRVAPEAMSCGKPVVAFASGGLQETITDGVNGFLVPRKDYIALAEKLSLLIEDRDLAIKMGLNGRKRVEENYPIRIVGKRYEDLYKMLSKDI